MSRKPASVVYRRFNHTEHANGNSLELLIRTAMDKTPDSANHKLKERYKFRILKRTDDSVLANIYIDSGEYVFGDITQITQDEMQGLLDNSKDDAAFADIEQYEKPDDKDFIRSLMYWMVKGDHCFIIQSHSLRADSAEEYFNWVVNDKAKVLQNSCPIVLASKFDASSVGGDIQDIQEIIVGGTVAHQHGATALQIETHEAETLGSIERSLQTVKSKAQKVLEALFSDTAVVDKILSQIPEDSSLSVNVHIGYRTKKKKSSREILKNVEVGLRHLPDNQLQVRGKDGKRSPDGTIRLQHPVSIKCVLVGEKDMQRSTGRLDHTDVLRAMLEAYEVFRNNGKITDDISEG
jgi:hypothetical protein